MALLAIAAVLAVYYLLAANTSAAGQYRMKLLNKELVSLREHSGLLSLARSDSEDPVVLESFASAHNMVRAAHIQYLFGTGSVALGKN